jgi:hypothetical protein
MKKIVVLAFCLLVIGSTAFALEKAAGGGILFGETFQGGSITGLGDWTFNRTSFGAFGFFGLSQYAEFNAAFMYKAVGTIKAGGVTVDNSGYVESTSALQFGVYGKYPFPISDQLVVFPTAGIDVELTLAEEWWHDIWIRAGGGVDYFLNDTMFIRGHFIYGLAIPVGVGSDIEYLNVGVGHGLLVKVGIGWMLGE